MIKTDPSPRSPASDKSRSTSRPEPADHYAALHQSFRWQVDEHFNIAEVCCSRWARADAYQAGATKKIAIRAHETGASGTFHTYLELQTAADALSHVLAGLGVQRGDRVAIVMPQRFETAVAYMAVFQMGAVAMPLSMLFGPEALQYRLGDSEAVVAICDDSSIASVQSVRADCPALQTVIGVGDAQGDLGYQGAAAAHGGRFAPVTTRANDAAILIYTSGTTGPPKGTLLAHRALIGNLPGFVCSQNWFGFSPHPSPLPQVGEGEGSSPTAVAEDRSAGESSCTLSLRERAGVRAPGSGSGSDAIFWSPADWAWTGGLMDALLPTLYFGRPIVAFNGRFTPELAFSLMQQHGVTHTFLFPTALKAMMKAYPKPRKHFDLQLEGLMSAGEAVGDAVFDYCRDELGVVVNEMFGQTEINYVVGNCNRFWPARAGSMGKGYPGHQVAVIDDDGQQCPIGVPGDVAVNRFDVHGDADPIFFLGYWKKNAATEAKFTGDWCRTGDLARRDADGYLWYEGRADDVFKAAGYRIGPGEIENCLVKHPAVANAAVVPKPDKDRGAVVKAYVVLAPEFIAARASNTCARGKFDSNLIEKLQLHVKKLLAPYEYPKEIEFIEALPMTTTGKVQRRVLRLLEEERFRALQPTL